MADRRCPFCGELVPSNSITCPKCFRKIPVEPEPVRKERRENPKTEQGRRYSKKLALILTLIPGLFGILGLGLIYRNPRQKRGYLALVFGALFFILAVFLTLGVFSIFIAVPCWIIYVLMYLGCAAMVLMDNVLIRMG